MNRRAFFPLIALLLLLSACRVVRGSGNVVEETRSVSNFDRVSLSGQGELILTQGEQESLEIEAEDNLIAVIETQVRGNTLHIGTRGNTSLNPTMPVRFFLTMKDVRGLEISGSGNAVAEVVATDQLTLDISGSGNITIGSLSAASLAAAISGSGGVEVAGEVASQVIDISGSGNYQAGDLESDTVDLKVSGAGETTVWAGQTLNVDISGSGSVGYYGSPTVSQDISGSGELNSLGTR